MLITIQVLGMILLVLVSLFAAFAVRWTIKIHPDSTFTEAWDCFTGKHQLNVYQVIEKDVCLMWCSQCRQAFEFNGMTRPHSLRFWTKDTQQFYTSMNYRIRPLPNAGVQLRKVHGGRAS